MNTMEKIELLGMMIHALCRKKQMYAQADAIRLSLEKWNITIECFPTCTRYYKGMKLIYEG